MSIEEMAIKFDDSGRINSADNDLLLERMKYWLVKDMC